MIRKQIIFSVTDNVEFSYNYQHDVLKNIYSYIKTANETRAKMLHNIGYKAESGHIYKLFNYTLLFENAVFKPDKIVCTPKTIIKLVVSGKKDIIELILKGVIVERVLCLDDSTLSFKEVLQDKRVRFEETMLYTSLSAIVTSTRIDGKGRPVYLTPYDEGYFKNLADNAKRKYSLVYGKDYTGEIFFDIDNLLDMREKFIQIKDGGVKGLEYTIWVQATKDMQKVLYYLGLGQNSSTGCGCLSFVKGVSEDE